MIYPNLILIVCILTSAVLHHIERLRYKRKIARLIEDLTMLKKMVDDLMDLLTSTTKAK